MDQEKVTVSVNPIDMTVTVVYKIHSFKALTKDIVEAIKLLHDLPGDLASRRFANKLLCNVLSSVAAKNSSEDTDKTVKESLADGEAVQVDELEN